VLSIQLLERAEQEITDAYTWYESQQSGLGGRFLNQIDYYLDLIGSIPYQYPSRFGQALHVAPNKTFPYLIVYWVEEAQQIILVTSIFHTSRKPRKF
jgi:toxin ParE1/3/4